MIGMTKIQTTLFVVFAGSFSVSSYFEPYPFAWLVKILPMFVLFWVVWPLTSSAPSEHLSNVKLFLVAIVFSSFGDVFLALGRDDMFIFGLGSFLVSHLFFISSFRPFNLSGLKFFPLYGGVGLGLFSLMSPNLGELALPVFVYMLVLVTMAISTISSHKSSKWLVLGGISFVVSDSLIGLNKFYTPIPHVGLCIMVTYYFAQFALVKGIVNALHKLKQTELEQVGS